MLVLEVGIKLDNDIEKYKNIILKNNNSINTFNCETHDVYWTNKNLDGLSENEMKKSCVRLRMVRGVSGNHFNGNNKWCYAFQNYNVYDANGNDKFEVSECDIDNYIKEMENSGWKKVFDTRKDDYQFCIGDMKSRIQLQNIDDIGLLLYYDNPNYYNLPLQEQRNALIDELNSYGFNFDYDVMGLDKLRTLYYKEEKYSSNQNG